MAYNKAREERKWRIWKEAGGSSLGIWVSASSPVYFKKMTVTPDDERAWFKKHLQWSKSNR